MSDPTPRHGVPARPSSAPKLLIGAIALLAFALGVWWVAHRSDASDDVDATATATPAPTPSPSAAEVTPTPLPTPTVAPTPTPYPGWVDPATSGQPWDAEVNGLLTFRGNPTRSWYGAGPVPTNPSIKWWYPDASTMCGATSVGGEIENWCGTGWTGQPAVFEREGRTWVVFGAFDYGVHFVDADTGRDIIPPFFTNDIIKGSVTIDPDGYPIVYTGSRDNYLRAIAFDRDQPVELWKLSASEAQGTKWNDDWDGTPMVIDDYLFEGGENSIFHIVKLNRGYDADGRVTVDPEIVFQAPGYDDELLAQVGSEVSIENSVAVSGNTVYFANSGGLVQGWDISGLADGVDPTRVFRYWVGEDVDASVVVDEEGMLYVGVEYEKGRARAQQIGQLVKLDPTKADDPLVWSVFDDDRIPSGAWATPALHRDLVIEAVQSGWVLGIDRATGEERWRLRMPGAFNWSSPVVVDDVLIMGDCEGDLHAYDVSDTSVEPPELWRLDLGSCIESTPAVWDGRIIVGVRAGQVYMMAD